MSLCHNRSLMCDINKKLKKNTRTVISMNIHKIQDINDWIEQERTTDSPSWPDNCPRGGEAQDNHACLGSTVCNKMTLFHLGYKMYALYILDKI